MVKYYNRNNYDIRGLIEKQAVSTMKVLTVLLKSINDVKDFVNIVNNHDFEIDLSSGRYVVDAKSIMGIFSLDLSKPINVELHSEYTSDIEKELSRFIV